MPEKSRRIFSTHRGRVTKTAAVPLRYAYEWCTDFRADDGKFSGSKPRFQVVRAAPNRLVRIRSTRPGSKEAALAVEIIRLRPPRAWHVDQIDENDLEGVDYELTRLGPKTTRIDLHIVERWMVPDYPRKADWVRNANVYWDRLVAALEKRYQRGLPARG